MDLGGRAKQEARAEEQLPRRHANNSVQHSCYLLHKPSLKSNEGSIVTRNLCGRERTHELKSEFPQTAFADKIVRNNFKRTQYGPKGGGQDARNKAPHKSLPPQLVQWEGRSSSKEKRS